MSWYYYEVYDIVIQHIGWIFNNRKIMDCWYLTLKDFNFYKLYRKN